MSVYSLASKINSVQIEVKSKASKNNPAFTGTVTGITAAMVGLGNVANTSDADKPVSGPVVTALSGKQNTLTSATNVTVGTLSSTGAINVVGNITKQEVIYKEQPETLQQQTGQSAVEQ